MRYMQKLVDLIIGNLYELSVFSPIFDISNHFFGISGNRARSFFCCELSKETVDTRKVNKECFFFFLITSTDEFFTLRPVCVKEVQEEKIKIIIRKHRRRRDF